MVAACIAFWAIPIFNRMINGVQGSIGNMSVPGGGGGGGGGGSFKCLSREARRYNRSFVQGDIYKSFPGGDIIIILSRGGGEGDIGVYD